MNRQRLLRLIDVLEAAPRDRFNLRFWDCGTTACAIGYACRDPEFQRQGLGFIPSYGAGVPTYDSGDGRHWEAWDAVEQFFDLHEETAQQLFFYQHYRYEATPQMVIERIKHVLGDKNNGA